MAGYMVSAAALTLVWGCPETKAQPVSARVYSINIPPKPLPKAIADLSAQTGLQVLYTGNQAFQRDSRAVSGRLAPEQALRQMLQGTGLNYHFVRPNAVTLDVPGQTSAAGAMPAGAITLDTIDVQGAGNPNSTMTPMPAYAGGQVATGGQLGLLGNRSIMDTPFNQTSYTAQLVQNQQARFITEALNNDPSVTVGSSQTVGTDIIGIRGFPVGNDQFLFNGLQGVAPSGQDATMLTESFERIEVLKGPSSLLNGIVGNVGGSINLVPKRAGDAPLTQFTPDYRMNSQFGGHLDVGRRFGDNKEFGMRFNGVYRDGGTPVDHQSRQSALATLGLDYRGERLRVDGDFGYQKTKVQGARRFTRIAAGIQVPEAPDNRTNWFDPAEFAGAEVLYGSLRGEFDVTDRLTAFAAFGGSESFQISFGPNRTITSVLGTLAGGTFPGDASLQKIEALSWLTGLRARLETGFVQHQIVFAYNTFEGSRSQSIASGAPGTPRPTSNIYNPIYGARPSFLTPSFGDYRPRRADITQSSFVAADTLSILEERLQLTVGARAQQIKADNFDTASGVATSRYDENAISPSVALVVKPLQNVSIYGNYIQGLQQGPIAPQGTANVGQVFAPYSAEQYETGVKVDFGSLAATMAFYQIANPSTYTDPSTNVFGINGAQRNRGIELNLFGEVATGFRVLGGVSYIDSVLLNTAGGINDGNRGIAVPQWRGVFGAEWDTPFIPGFTLTGRVIRNDSVFVDQANLQRVPAWTVLNIGARYRIERSGGQPIVIRAGIDNVLNSSHWEAPNSVALFLSAPRTFYLSTTFNF